MPVLDAEELDAFGRDGYLVLRGCADDARCAAADAEVDELIEGEPPTVDGGGQDATFWFEPVARLPRCHDLLRATPAAAFAARGNHGGISGIRPIGWSPGCAGVHPLRPGWRGGSAVPPGR